MSTRGSERLADPPARSPAPDEHEPPRPSLEEIDLLLRVVDILRSVRFGSVLIVVQEGRVVQIETAEKIRLP